MFINIYLELFVKKKSFFEIMNVAKGKSTENTNMLLAYCPQK